MKKSVTVFFALLLAIVVYGQQFEESITDEKPDEIKVKVGADFAMQYQGIEHHADSSLIPLGKGINLPTANLIIDATLADGIVVNLTTYLSSRHHVEAWVKGGYLLLDKLPFIKSDFVTKAMDYLTFKAGVMEINYGDAHFRRSDNGNVIKNPFVGNLVIDAFTTAPAFEVLFRNKGILLMGAITTGSLKPALTGYSAGSKTYTPYYMGDELAYYGKVGYDKQITDDFRFRATVSGYFCANHHFGSLYNGDRTGSRYYLVMNRVKNAATDVDPASGHMSGQWGPGLTDKDNSVMVNLFTKYKGLELFGTYETVTGTPSFGGNEFTYSQYAVEAICRFGKEENFFGGVRYGDAINDTDMSVDRLQIGAGWFMTKNIVIKAEYVDQNYTDFTTLYGANAGFEGIMLEAGISF